MRRDRRAADPQWVLARWGRNPPFDRIWPLLTILLTGFEAVLFGFDLWIA